MEVLKYKTVTAISGAASVGTGLSADKIIKVSRQGEQKDYAPLVAIGTLDGSNFIHIAPTKRISFGTSFPFVGSEVIHIIYKL